VIDDPCLAQNAGRRRIFWTTQPEACGSYVSCGVECSIPGLVYEDSTEPHISVEPAGRTIKTTDWINSLILNILNTRARSDIRCPSPAAVYGHWSESYRGDGLWVGSRLWNAASKSYIRVADSVKAIEAAVKADVGKLVVLGVADSVSVDATYQGRNSVAVVVVATHAQARHVVNLSGTLTADTWIWR
jgi:hypothetical protein